MAVTPQSVKALAPELDSLQYGDALMGRAITVAKTLFDKGELATSYLAAHVAILMVNEASDKPDGGSGEVLREQQGDQEVDYVAQAHHRHEAFYATTAYGRVFLQLRHRSAARAMSIRVWG